MEILSVLWEFVIHLDNHLALIIEQFGAWTYLLLFFVIFTETGLVIFPFLPGDSLLFVAGSLAGQKIFNVVLLFFLLTAAAIIGDTVNYFAGSWIGAKVFNGRFRYLTPDHLHKTHLFFARHGGKAIIMARFIPLMRTFVPFVAGMGSMQYGRFFTYNIIGGILWVSIFLFSGYYFGSVPIVQNNFGLVIIAVIVLSLVPMMIELIQENLRHLFPLRLSKKHTPLP